MSHPQGTVDDGDTVDLDGEAVKVLEPWAKVSVFWPHTNLGFFTLGGMINKSTHAASTW